MKRSIEEDGERQNCPTLNLPKSHNNLFFDLFERKNKGLNIFGFKKIFTTPFFIDFVGKVIILCDITLLLNIYSNYKTLDTLCDLWILWA